MYVFISGKTNIWNCQIYICSCVIYTSKEGWKQQNFKTNAKIVYLYQY